MNISRTISVEKMPRIYAQMGKFSMVRGLFGDNKYYIQWHMLRRVSKWITIFPSLLFKYAGCNGLTKHYSDVIMGAMASQITSLTTVYSTTYSGEDQRKHQMTGEFPARMASNAEIFPFDDVIRRQTYSTKSRRVSINFFVNSASFMPRHPMAMW